MAEHRIEITIAEGSEDAALTLLESLERQCPELGPVMVQHADAGTFEYVLATDAKNAIEACGEVGRKFVRAVGSTAIGQVSIVDLHARAVPAAELDDIDTSQLQPA